MRLEDFKGFLKVGDIISIQLYSGEIKGGIIMRIMDNHIFMCPYNYVQDDIGDYVYFCDSILNCTFTYKQKDKDNEQLRPEIKKNIMNIKNPISRVEMAKICKDLLLSMDYKIDQHDLEENNPKEAKAHGWEYEITIARKRIFDILGVKEDEI